MASVDNRVVRMDFDNKKFEQDVKTTTSSLDKLKQSLNFDKAKGSFQQISDSAKTVSLQSISTSIDSVKQGFSALSIAAGTILAGIGTQVVGLGANMAKSLSVKPMLDGFKEYETNMGSIQTILSNTATKGTTLDDVTVALDKLNAYSDQTIYNFGEMAKNIGTFTAAGVDLDTSVASIKGIANLAAMSGTNAEKAAGAMYQLSQAVASGRFSIMDLNSVNAAGMGGEAFKTTLFETGKALGTIKNTNVGQTFAEWEKANGSFRESLESGWVNSDVLTTAFATFTGDLNEETLIAKGFSQEQATLLMQQADRAKAAATEVKTITQLVSTLKESMGTGWADSFKLVLGNFEEAKFVLTAVNNAFGGMISRSADARNQMLGVWKAFGGRTVLIQGLVIGFKALAKIVNVVKSAFHSVFPPVTVVTLLSLTKRFKELMERLTPTGMQLEYIRGIARGVFSVFSIAISIVSGLAKIIWNLGKAIGGAGKVVPMLYKLGNALFELKKGVDSGFVGFLEKVSSLLSGLASGVIKTALEFIFGIFGGIGGQVESASNSVSKLGGAFDVLKKAIGGITEAFSKAFSKDNFSTSIDLVKVGLLGGLLLVFRKFFNRILSFDFGSGFIKNMTNIFEQLGNTLKAFQLGVKADALLKIAAALAVVTASLVVLSLIDAIALVKALTAMGVAFALLGGMLFFLQKMATDVKKGASIGILAGSLIALSVAMLILSFAVKVFSSMSWEELGKGMLGVAGMLLIIGVALKYMPSARVLISSGIAMIAIAIAIKMLAYAVQQFAKMGIEDLKVGLLGVAASLALMIIAVKELPDPKEMIGKGLGIIAFAAGLTLLAVAVKLFGGMDPATLAIGLGVIVFSIAAIIIALKQMPKNMETISAGFLAIGASLLIMAVAISLIGSLNTEQLVRGLAGIAGVLIILVAVTKIIKKDIAAVQGIAVMAASLMLLSLAVRAFASMSWADMLQGLLGIALALGIIVAAAMIVFPALPALIGLAIALGLLGFAMLTMGVAAMALAKAIEIFQRTGTSSLAAIGAIIGAVISRIGDFVLALFSAFMGVVQRFFSELPNLLRQLVTVITRFIPVLINLFVTIVTNILTAIRDNIPTLVTLIVEIIATFINTIAANLGTIIEAGTNLIVAWIRGMDNASQLVIDAVTDLIVNFITGIRNSATRIIEAGRSLIVTVINGMDDAITDPNDGIVPAIRNLIISFINAVADSYGDIIDAGVKAVAKFLEGLGDNAWEIVNAAGKFILSVLNALEAGIKLYGPQIRNAAIRIGLAIIDGMTFGLGTKALKFMGLIDDVGAQAIDAARESVDAHSPSRAFMEIGKDMMDGLTIGISRGSSVVNATSRVGSDAVKALNNSLSLVSSSLENLGDFNPTITPVLDLSNVQNGSKFIGSMLGSSSINANVSFGKASAISAVANQNTKNTAVKVSPQVNEIKFEQTINSPVALTTSEIYRNTKTQISMAKEELRLV